MTCNLVIFDCDGVLVDTEAAANRHLVAELTQVGYPVSLEECRRRFVGRALWSIQQEIEAEAQIRFPPDWSEAVRTDLERVFDVVGVNPVPGAQAAVRALQDAGLPCCVASSGRMSKMRKTLGLTGLLPMLQDVLFSADMVANGKPAPDLFLYAAAAMGVLPRNAVVVEDSVPGAIAGSAAGMRVFGYVGDPETDAAGLDAHGAHLFDDMTDLPRLIADNAALPPD
ncbi:MAG: HAD family phosphatase [Rhodospirillaceae bacterium]|nr:HAD family phosphatase [Rhodospirillaceae bacterium]